MISSGLPNGSNAIVATAAEWNATTIAVLNNCFAYESDTYKFKIGDGISLYSELPYIINIPSTTLDVGITRFATDEETHEGISDAIAVTPAGLSNALSSIVTQLDISGTNADGDFLNFEDISGIVVDGNAYLSAPIAAPAELGIATEQISTTVNAVSGSSFIVFEYNVYTATPPVPVTQLETYGDCYLFYGTFSSDQTLDLTTYGDGDTIAAIVTGRQKLQNHFSGPLTSGEVASVVTITASVASHLYFTINDRYNNCLITTETSVPITTSLVSTISTSTEPNPTGVLIGMDIPEGETTITITAGSPGFSSSVGYLGVILNGFDDVTSTQVTLTVPPLIVSDTNGTTITNPHQLMFVGGTLNGNDLETTFTTSLPVIINDVVQSRGINSFNITSGDYTEIVVNNNTLSLDFSNVGTDGGSVSVSGNSSSNGLFDISAGVPSLTGGAVTTLGDTSTFQFTGNGALGLNVKCIASSVSTTIAGFLMPIPSTPVNTAIYGMYNGASQYYFGLSFGFYNSATGALAVLTIADTIERGSFYSFQTWANNTTRISDTEPSNIGISPASPNWLHLLFDGTTMSFGNSKDGANPYIAFTQAASAFLGTPTHIFFGGFFATDSGNTFNSIDTSMTFLCYDTNGANRKMGVSQSAGSTSDTISGGVVELVSVQNVSGATEVDFTGFVAGYEYFVTGVINEPSDSDYVILQLGTGSGPTWDNSNAYSSITSRADGQGSFSFNTNAFTFSTQYPWPGSSTIDFSIAGDPTSICVHGIKGMYGYYASDVVGSYVNTVPITGARLLWQYGSTLTGSFYLYRRSLTNIETSDGSSPYTTPILTNFTQLNITSTSNCLFTQNGNSILMDTDGGAGGTVLLQTSGVVWDPGTTFTSIVAVTPPQSSIINYCAVGAVVAQSLTSIDDSIICAIQAQNYVGTNGPFLLNNNYENTGSVGPSAGVTITGSVFWVRIRISGTTCYTDISNDGQAWWNCWSGSLPSGLSIGDTLYPGVLISGYQSGTVNSFQSSFLSFTAKSQ